MYYKMISFRVGMFWYLTMPAIHTGKENTVLEDYLWETYGIFLLFLLARAPEWNPMEQIWKHGVQGLKDDTLLPLNKFRQTGTHATAYAFMAIMDGISHDEVQRFYAGSGLSGND